MYFLKKIVSIILTILLFLSFLKQEEYIENKINLKHYFKEERYNSFNDYIAVLEIPKINFKRGLYSKESKLNNIDNNIAFYQNTEYPNNNTNTIILGHSGNSKISFFENLKYLEIGDVVNFYYNNSKLNFEIANIYEVPKTGTIDILRNQDKMTITLITCIPNDKQLVIIAYKKNNT